MNTYKAFYCGNQTEIKSETLYGAKVQAVQHFNPRKSQVHMVHVELVAVGEREIVHIAVN